MPPVTQIPTQIPLDLEAELEKYIGPFLSTPLEVPGGSNSYVYSITTLPPPGESRHASLPSQPSHVLKLPRNAYTHRASPRERGNLALLATNLSRRPGLKTPLSPSIPSIVPVSPPLSQEAVLMSHLPGVDGAAAWMTTKTHGERVELSRAFGRAARWVHSLGRGEKGTDFEGLPPPVRTALPAGVDDDVRDPEENESCTTAREWLRQYLRAESARIAPQFTDLLPDPPGVREVPEGTERRDKAQDQERAIGHITTMERALADPTLWDGGRDALTFVHGDFCLPNVLFSRMERDGATGGVGDAAAWRAVGLVDWADCGLADRRYDLRSGVWSLKFNAKLGGQESEEEQEEYVLAFLKAYVDGAAGLVPRGNGAGDDVQWVLEDWARFLEEKRAGGGTVKEDYWQAWAAAYELYEYWAYDDDSMVEEPKVFL